MGIILKLKKSTVPISAALVFTILSPLLGFSEAKYFFIFADGFYFPLSVSLLFLFYFFPGRLKPIHTEPTIIDALVYLFFLYNVVNTWVLNNIGFSSSVSTIVTPLLLYLVVKHLFSEEKETSSSPQTYFVISILVIALIPIVIGILEYGGMIPLAVHFNITGGFLNPGVFANFIASIFPFVLAIVTRKGTESKRVKLGAAFILVGATGILVVSNARSAWVASSISALFVLGHNKRFSDLRNVFLDSYIKKIIFIITLTTGIAVASFFLYNLKKDSTDGRLFIWKLCVEMIKENPIFGIGSGYNSFPKAFNEQQRSYFEQNPHDTDNGLLAGDAKYAFNDYMQLMIETGAVGLALFICILFFSLNGKNGQKNITIQNYDLLIASQSSIIAFLVCSLFSYPQKNISNFALFFVFIAYISSCHPAFKHQIPFKNSFMTIASAMLAVLASAIIYYQICLLRHCYKWKEAYIYYQTGNIKNALEGYKRIQPFFNSYFLFMFNYGSILYVNGNFDDAIHIFELSTKLNATYDTFLNLGGCYERISQFGKAEDCYIRASYTIPHKLSPKYNLLKLYIKTNKSTKAYEIASVIINMKIKIDTPVAVQMKREAFEYLKKKGFPPLLEK
jgi:O-antigen polymerase